MAEEHGGAAPVGRVKGALDEQSIRLVGRIESPADFNDIVVKRQGSEVVRLGQVATIEDGAAEPSSFSLRNGHANVGMNVIRTRESSSVAVAHRVRAEVEEISSRSPTTVAMTRSRASTTSSKR